MKRNRWICLALCLALFLPGCRKKETVPAQSSGVGDVVRSHYYDEAELPLPEGTMLNLGAKPVWSAERGELTCLVSRTDPAEGENGEIIPVYQAYLVVTGRAGVVRQSRLELPEGQGIRSASIGAEGVFAIIRTDAGYDAVWFDPDGKALRREERVDAYFDASSGVMYDGAEFGDGGLALLSMGELLVLRADRSVLRREKLEGAQNAYSVPMFAKGADGTLRLIVQEEGSVRFSVIGEDGQIGEARGISGFGYAFGPEFEAYMRDTSGVWGIDYSESGTQNRTLLLDAVSSGLKRFATLYTAAEDALFFTYYENERERLFLYTPGVEPDRSNARVLRIATSMTEIGYKNEEAVSAYNRTHTDVQFEIDSYAKYPPENGQPGGGARLAREILTGTYTPDIIIDAADSLVMPQIFRHGLYRDLGPYLDRDPRVNREDLFSSVLRAFDDGEGGIWGIMPYFNLRTLVAREDLFGPFAEQGYWTLSEMLDYIEGLPDGVTFKKNLYRGKAEELLYGGNAYLAFTDGTACSFDSPDFLRFLRWLESLPDEKTYRARSPYANPDPLEQNVPFLTGELIAAETTLAGWETFSKMAGPFLSKDWCAVGYPSPIERAGAGIAVSSLFAVVITKDCADPDAAWDLIRTFFEPTDDLNLPALRSNFRAVMESRYDTCALWYNSYGGMSAKWKIREEEMERPGIIVDTTPEDAAKWEAIAESAGIPLRLTYLSEELKEILHEEISFFLGGVGSAEDCAAKIQSRASILLSENG